MPKDTPLTEEEREYFEMFIEAGSIDKYVELCYQKGEIDEALNFSHKQVPSKFMRRIIEGKSLEKELKAAIEQHNKHLGLIVLYLLSIEEEKYRVEAKKVIGRYSQRLLRRWEEEVKDYDSEKEIRDIKRELGEL